MVQAVLQGDGVVAPATAQAALGASGGGLSTAWTPPVPAYRPVVLSAPRLAAADAAGQHRLLVTRGEEWRSLTPVLRAGLDHAAALHGPRARWCRLVVEGTGEHEGGGTDLAFASRRGPAAKAERGRFLAAHFVIGNGTRSGDGGIERTGRPLEGEDLVIALIGDFSRRGPTPAQLQALTELVDYARAKTGVIPVVLGDAARAPVSAAVLNEAYHSAPVDRPREDLRRT